MTPRSGLTGRNVDVRKSNVPSTIDQNAGYAMTFNGTDEYLTRALPTDIASFNPANANGDWTKYGTYTLDSNVTTEAGSTRCIRINATQANQGIYKTSLLTVGKKYKFKIRYKSTVDIRVGHSQTWNAYPSLYLSSTSQWNTVEKTFTAVTDNQLWLSTATGAGTILIESISIVEDWKLDLNESYELIKHSINRDFEQTLVTTYASNFSAGVDGWFPNSNTTVTGNIDNIGGENDCIKTTVVIPSGTAYAYSGKTMGQVIGKRYKIKARYFIPSSNISVKKLIIFADGAFGTPLPITTDGLLDQWVQVEYETMGISTGGARFYAAGTTGNNLLDSTANGDVFYLKDIQVYEIPNLVTNGTFTDPVTEWTSGAGCIISGGKANISGSGVLLTSIAGNPLIPNKRYRYRFDLADFTGSIAIWGSQGSGYFTTGGTKSGDFTFTSSPNSNIHFYANMQTTGSIDNFHIYELPDYTSTGNHSFTYTTADKYAGTSSLKITSTGAGTSGSNYVSLPSAQIETLVVGNKYTKEVLAKLDPTSLTYGSDLFTSIVNGTSLPMENFSTTGSSFSASSAGVTNYQGCSINVPFNTGDIVQLSFNVTVKTGGNIDVAMAVGNGGALAVGSVFSINGTGSYTLYFKVTSDSSDYIQFNSKTTGDYSIAIDNIVVKKASGVNLTSQIGTKSVTTVALDPNAWTKTVLNFEATASEVSQDLKLYLSGAGSVFVDNISLTQAYDMVRLSSFKTGVLGNTLESTIFMIGGVGATNAGGIWSYVSNPDRLFRASIQDTEYKTSTSFITPASLFLDNSRYSVCEYYDKVNSSHIYVDNISRVSTTNLRIIGKVINNATDYPLRIGTWSASATVKFKGSISPIQIIRFENISQSNFDPTTFKVGQSVSGGGAESVLLLDFGKDKTSMTSILKDWSGTGNNVTGVNVDQTNVVRKA